MGLYLAGYFSMLAGETAWLPDTHFFVYFSVTLLVISALAMLSIKLRKFATFLILSTAAMIIFRLYIGDKYQIGGRELTATMVQVWAMCSIGIIHFVVPNRLTEPVLILLPVVACGYFLYFSVLRNIQIAFNLFEINSLVKAGEVTGSQYQLLVESLPEYYLSSFASGLCGLFLVAVYFAANWPKLSCFKNVA
ncbi:hypothetical protein [Vibrio atlanticus]|uniref:hypothetical protein n=1 Tax=Vibrio atlanticus TaxID=693153 RepID=UPI000EFB5562|nr:hypothetical protein [Vibrio atlanticus]